MCLKYLLSLFRSEKYTSGRRVRNFGIVYTAAVWLSTAKFIRLMGRLGFRVGVSASYSFFSD